MYVTIVERGDKFVRKKQILLHTKKCENVDKDLYDYVLGKHNQRPDPAEYAVPIKSP